MSALWSWNGSAGIFWWLYLFGWDAKKINAIIARLKKKFDLTVEDTKDDDTDVVLKLNKSLYGLVQAPLCLTESE